jgi:hypothetical protein
MGTDNITFTIFGHKLSWWDINDFAGARNDSFVV